MPGVGVSHNLAPGLVRLATLFVFEEGDPLLIIVTKHKRYVKLLRRRFSFS